MHILLKGLGENLNECKLKEAKHFLEKLHEVQGVEDKFRCFLDRFLVAM